MWLEGDHDHQKTAALANAELERFHAQRAVVGNDLLHSPAWVILVAMLTGPRPQTAHPFAELSRACGLSESLLSRWIGALESQGLVEAGSSVFGRHATLTQSAEASLRGYFRSRRNHGRQEPYSDLVSPVGPQSSM